MAKSRRVSARKTRAATAAGAEFVPHRLLPPGPAAVVLLALVIRVIVLVQLGNHPRLQPTGVLDDAVYVQLANRVAAGDLALGPDVYFLSPFYTYFLGVIFALTGGSTTVARVIQVLLGAAAVGLITSTATFWFGKRAGLVAGALAACTGMLAFNEILILQSSVDTFLTSLALFALTKALRSRSWLTFAAAGLAFGALALNRPNALPCVGAIAVVWVAAIRSRAAAVQAAVLVLGTSLVLAPVALRNRIVAGEQVLITSHGGLNFYIGNGPGADGTWKSLEGISPAIAGQARDARRVASSALGRPASANEASSYYYGLAWQWIRSNPGSWAYLMVRKLALTFNALDVALNYSYTYFSRDESSLLSVLVVGPWLVIPLGLFGLAVGAPRGQAEPYFTWLSFVPVYAFGVALFFVSSRYRLPLLVPLTSGAGVAVVWLWERLSTQPKRRMLEAAVALPVLFVFVNWPMRADEGRMYERGERIVQLMSDGRLDEAQRLLTVTERQYPQPGLLLYRIGLVFRERRDAGRAVAYLERALAADPKEPRIHFNLGEALLEVGRPADAITHLQAARAAGVEPATVAYDLAGAFQALGQPDQARNALASIRVTSGMDGPALVELGESALALQDAALAERFLREATVRAPALASAHLRLGAALAAQGKSRDAAAQLETALRLDPADATARFLLAMLAAQEHRFPEARHLAEEALRLRPDYVEARDLLSRLPPEK